MQQNRIKSLHHNGNPLEQKRDDRTSGCLHQSPGQLAAQELKSIAVDWAVGLHRNGDKFTQCQGCKWELFFQNLLDVWKFVRDETEARTFQFTPRARRDRDLPFRDRDVFRDVANGTLCQAYGLQNSNCYKLCCVSVIFIQTTEQFSETFAPFSHKLSAIFKNFCSVYIIHAYTDN